MGMAKSQVTSEDSTEWLSACFTYILARLPQVLPLNGTGAAAKHRQHRLMMHTV
jgi:hypothetical protein